jgi:hypothetical protein
MTEKTKIWPEANEKGLGWTAMYPRPTEDHGHHPAVVAARQAEWDQAESTRVKHARRADEIRAARELAEQEARDAAAAKDAEREQKRRRELEAMLRKRFILAGGHASEWEREKAQIVADHIRTQASTGRDPAREAQASLYRSF